MTRSAIFLVLALCGSVRAQSPAPPAQGSPEESVIAIDKFDDCGLITRFSPNKIKPECFQALQNVTLDQDFSLLRRNGYSPYNATACTGGQAVRGLWAFNATDGSQYIIMQSSGSMFQSKGDGTCTVITGLNGGLSTTATMSCVQTLGYLWCADGPDIFRTNVTSTDVVTGAPAGATYVGAFRNRVVMANATSNQTSIYLSGELNGLDWTLPTVTMSTSAAILKINGINDGLPITCLMGEYQNAFLIGRNRDLWGLYGNDLRDFSINQISNQVGCMDNRSIQEVDNVKYWLSRRGVEAYTGTQINRASFNIDPTLNTIITAAGNSQSQVFTTQGDFQGGNLTASGAGAPISATISVGDLVPSTGTFPVQNSTSTLTHWIPEAVANSSWNLVGVQWVASSATVNSSIAYGIESPGFDDTISSPIFNCSFFLQTVNPSAFSYTASLALQFSSISITGPWGASQICASTSPVTVTAQQAYLVSGNGSITGNGRYVKMVATTTFAGGRWIGGSQANAVYLSSFTLLAETTGYYITPCITAAGNTTWGNLGVNGVTNGGSFTFWMSTSGVSCSQVIDAVNANWTSVNPNAVITVPVSSYTAVRVLFGVDVGTEVVTLNDITVNWNAGASRPPVTSVNYKNEYWMFYTTSSAVGAYNDHAIVLDENKKWTTHNDINAASAAIYLNTIYTGDSKASGSVFQQDTGGADNGGAFTESFTTADLDGGDPMSLKTFKRAYLIVGAPNSTTQGASFTCNYALSGSSTTYSLGTVNLSEAPEGQAGGYFVSKLPFPTGSPTRGQWVNLSCSNTGTVGPLRIYGIRIVYIKNEWP